MKKSICYFIILTIFGMACEPGTSLNMKSFMPGTYVKPIDQEFATGMDTIIVEILDESAASYTIIRKSSYQQKVDGKLLSPKNENHRWTAIWGQETRQLKEQNKGRVFTFSPEQRTLTMGSTEYIKVD